MSIIHVVTDEAGVVRVERRPGTFFKEASVAKDLAAFGIKGIDTFNPLKVAPNILFHDLTVLAVADSKRLTDAEKVEYLNILGEANPITDDYEGEEITGEFERTHPTDTGSAAPPDDTVHTRIVDP